MSLIRGRTAKPNTVYLEWLAGDHLNVARGEREPVGVLFVETQSERLELSPRMLVLNDHGPGTEPTSRTLSMIRDADDRFGPNQRYRDNTGLVIALQSPNVDAIVPMEAATWPVSLFAIWM